MWKNSSDSSRRKKATINSDLKLIAYFDFSPNASGNFFCLTHITISVIIHCFIIMLCIPTCKLSSKPSKTSQWLTIVKFNLLITISSFHILLMNVVLCSTKMSNPAGYHVELERSKNRDDLNEYSIVILVHFSLPILCMKI